MERKQGFTLVEMLIVVVLIGILGAAILPRFSGYLERTRDLKRQADLRNIAVAIQRYKDDHGGFPRLEPNLKGYWTKTLASPVISLRKQLADYLSSIPKDPNPQNLVLIHFAWHSFKANPSIKDILRIGEPDGFIPKGEYVYQVTMPHYTNPPSDTRVFLIAKVETPEYANYVMINTGSQGESLHKPGGTFMHRITNPPSEPILPRDFVYLCDEVTKTNEPKGKRATATNTKCTYTSEDQLYYIIKIE